MLLEHNDLVGTQLCRKIRVVAEELCPTCVRKRCEGVLHKRHICRAEVAVDAQLLPCMGALVGDDACVFAFEEEDVALLDDGLLLAQTDERPIEMEDGVCVRALCLGVDRVGTPSA